MDTCLFIYHLVIWSNFNFLYISQWISIPTYTWQVLYSFCDSLFQSLIMWVILFFQSQLNLQLQCYIIDFHFDIICPYGVLCRYEKNFSFSLNISFKLSCPGLFAWDFANLSLEICIQLFYFSYLFRNFCSFSLCRYCFTSHCYRSFFDLFNVVFDSFHCWISAVFSPSESTSFSFSWHILSVHIMSRI